MELFKIFGTIALNRQEQFNSGIDTATEKGSTFATKLAKGFKTIAKVGGAALTAVGTGMMWLSKQAIDSYGDYEQLVGGAKLMFGDAYDFIAEKSANAYKNVQMSQNEYLKQVNGFATGLKTALGGNEQAAAELADRIITAEADVVAATGNTQEAVQNAFNGIMKSNYTMLDNLQIGITPTKEGFQEVIDKVNEWNEANGRATEYQIENLADCQNALIDYIEMQGLSGYAAAEAADTIQGSLAMAKAAWQNLITGMSDPEQDLGLLVDNMVESAGTALDRLAPRITNLLPRITTGVGTLVKKLNQKVPGLIRELLPSLISGSVSLVTGLAAETPAILGALWDAVKATWETLTEEFPILGDIENAVAVAAEKITGALAPLALVFQPVIDALAPLVDKAIEWVTSGQAAADVTVGIEGAFSTVIGAITTVNESIAEFVSWLRDGSAGAEALKTTIVAVTAAITTYKIITAAVSVAQKVWTAVTTGVAAAQKILNAVLNANPIGIIITLISALVAAFIYLWNNCEGFRNFWINLWEGIKAALAPVVERLKVYANDIKQIFLLAWEGIKAVWAGVTGYFEMVWNTIKGIFEVVEAVFKGDFEGAWEAIQGIVSGWAEYFSGVWDSIKEVFSKAVEVGSGIVNDIKQGISDAWAGITSWFTNLWDSLFGNRTVNVDVSTSGGGGGGVDGSHARGLDFVPFDGYVAELHKGEMVVPAAEAQALRSGYSGTQNGEMASLLKQILTAIEDSNRKETVLKINNRELGRAVRGAVHA